VERLMQELGGANGGAIAGAAMLAWAGATAFWMGVGAVIWRLFFEPRIKAMQKQLDEERDRNKEAMAEERHRCDEEIQTLRDRVKQLELLLLLHGPQALRQSMQAALSEQHVALDEVRKDKR
jgi:hypothetical protein